jgi:unsaturated pyranuronate lyase
VTGRSPQHHRWTDLRSEALTGSIGRRYVTADRVTVARFELKQGGVVPRHAHDNEQVSCVLSGSLLFTFDDREVTVGAGEVMQIPGGIPHEVTVLADTVVIDVFSPVRQDWIDGTDTYFRAGVRG